MATKIGGVEGAQIASIGAGRAVQPAGGAATQGAQDTETGDVQITGTARTLAALEQALRDVPAVNDTRVAQIRSAIEQGTYTVQPDHVADQMMQIERFLGSLGDFSEPVE